MPDTPHPPWEKTLLPGEGGEKPARGRGNLEIAPVQILRAIAAIGVSILHVAQEAGAFVGQPGESPYWWLKILPWEAGVDLFFVISGFVMVYASVRLFGAPGGARRFLGRRIARIVPL